MPEHGGPGFSAQPGQRMDVRLEISMPDGQVMSARIELTIRSSFQVLRIYDFLIENLQRLAMKVIYDIFFMRLVFRQSPDNGFAGIYETAARAIRNNVLKGPEKQGRVLLHLCTFHEPCHEQRQG